MLQQIAHAIARCGAAGFAGGQARARGLVQPRGKAADLRGFAAALGALESNK